MASQKNWKNEDCDAEKTPADASSPSAPSMIFADPLRVNAEEKRILSPASVIATAPRFGKTEIELSVSEDSVMLRRPKIGAAPSVETPDNVSDASPIEACPIIASEADPDAVSADSVAASNADSVILDAETTVSDASVTLRDALMFCPELPRAFSVSSPSVDARDALMVVAAALVTVSADSVCANAAEMVTDDADATESDASTRLEEAAIAKLEVDATESDASEMLAEAFSAIAENADTVSSDSVIVAAAEIEIAETEATESDVSVAESDPEIPDTDAADCRSSSRDMAYSLGLDGNGMAVTKP